MRMGKSGGKLGKKRNNIKKEIDRETIERREPEKTIRRRRR